MATAVRADFRSSRWRGRLALIAVVAWIAYEWGPGNETVTPFLVLAVLDRTEAGVASVVVPATVGFAFTLVQQLLSGVTALAGFSMFAGTAQAAWRRLSVDGTKEVRGWHEIGGAAKVAVAWGLGTTAVALAQIVTTGTVGVVRHLRAVVQSAFLAATGVGVLAAGVGGLAWLGRSVPSMRGSTDVVIRVLGNPLLWLGLVVVTLVMDRRAARRATAVAGS
ncbi:MAG: hypothetical protein ACK5CE_11660 [Actinomycetes bacterium]|jgi:hypothetical protein|uniref:Unannotated protein n=1 Tax=freshwater metagenome TaxID=449393 RepID=A0A6J6BHT9_9ZZZZ|nr:hypothetical protein [Actinomycetota bacterium]